MRNHAGLPGGDPGLWCASHRRCAGSTMAQVVSTIEMGKQVNTFAFLSDKLVAVGCEEDTQLRVCNVDTECVLLRA